MTAIDTNFLIDLDNIDSPRHEKVLALFNQWRAGNDKLYIYSHVFLEYQHVISDAKRFTNPLSMEQARQRVLFWKNQKRIEVIYETSQSFDLAQSWMSKYNLGRKRIAETHMAAAYFCNGITTLLTANPKDFEIFNIFNLPWTELVTS